MVERIEAIVVGAGVIGLACARALARAGIETIIIEQNTKYGQEISARNSEVIHAGIYYPQGSLKAKLCLKGRELLYDFIRDYNIPAQKCGKLIVSTAFEQESKLIDINNLARQNGIHNLVELDFRDVKRIEPSLKCSAALLSPSTGIISSHDYMLALLGDAESHGAMIALRTKFLFAEIKNEYFEIYTEDSPSAKLQSRMLINSGGLYATKIARNIIGLHPKYIPCSHLAKGNYFSLNGRSPFTHLIYPIPEPGGLGIHLTLDLAGRARFGPDVEWVNELNYEVNIGRQDSFYSAIRAYWPELKNGELNPDYSGIRPKIVGPGENDADFIIQDVTEHSIPGLVNLFGIESPGLTSSLAIADAVVGSLIK